MTLFPFELPFATASYLLLYVVTLLMHMVLMFYVLGGALVLAARGVSGLLGRPLSSGVITQILKDWMPFALSGAITAGIAPLLFVQVLYQQQFYTANLLAFHRWMSILPILIIAFYLMYLLKAKRLQQRTLLLHVTAVGVAMCVLFVAWSWVENHLLMLHEEVWTSQYAAHAWFYGDRAIVPRLAFWVAGSFPTLALLLAWQVRGRASGVSAADGDAALQKLAKLALFAFPVMVVLAIPTMATSTLAGRQAIGEFSTGAYGAIVIAGLGVQLWGWVRVLRRPALSNGILWFITTGMAGSWLGLLMIRELMRVRTLDISALSVRHQQVATDAGLIVFLIFSLIAVGAVIWMGREITRANLQAGTIDPDQLEPMGR